MMRPSIALVVLAAAAATCTEPARAGAGGAGMSSGLSAGAQNLQKPTCAKGDPVVWLNTKYNAYFPESSPYYAHTYNGTFICRSDAIAKGAHLSKTVTAPAAPGEAVPSGTPASPGPNPPAPAQSGTTSPTP